MGLCAGAEDEILCPSYLRRIISQHMQHAQIFKSRSPTKHLPQHHCPQLWVTAAEALGNTCRQGTTPAGHRTATVCMASSSEKRMQLQSRIRPEQACKQTLTHLSVSCTLHMQAQPESTQAAACSSISGWLHFPPFLFFSLFCSSYLRG